MKKELRDKDSDDTGKMSPEALHEFAAAMTKQGPAEIVLKAWADQLAAPVGLFVRAEDERFYSYSRSAFSPRFCQMIRQSPSGEAACMKCDLAVAKRCEASKKTIVYKCWTGLTDVAVPITYQGTVLGVVFSGQVRVDPSPPDSQILESLQRLGISREEWMKAFSEVRVSSQVEFQMFIKAVEQIAEDVASALTRPSHVYAVDNIECVNELTPELISYLKHHESDIEKLPWDVFEHLIAELFASWGYTSVHLVGRSKETAADVIAVERPSKCGVALRYFIEVKRRKDRIGVEIIDRVIGAVARERSRWGWHIAMICSAADFADFRNTTKRELSLRGVEIRGPKEIQQWLRDYQLTDRGLWLPKEVALKPVTPEAL
jgi:ligand-binding sensor protein